MDLRQLRYFLHVAELGSFSRAAESLAVAQSALSRQVALLEDELGQPLLTRTGRGVQANEAGRRFCDHCHTILRQVEDARADLAARRDTPTGHLVLGMPPSAGRVLAMPVVGAFRATFPQATISVVEGLSADLIERMHAGRVNLALVYEPTSAAGLNLQPLARQDLFVVSVAARSTKGRTEETIRLRDLADLPLIMPGRAHAMRRHIEAELMKAKVPINVTCEIDGIPALLELVAQGLGHAVLPRDAISPFDLPRFSLRAITAPRLSITLAMATPGHRRGNALARATLKLLAEVVPGALAVKARRGPGA